MIKFEKQIDRDLKFLNSSDNAVEERFKYIPKQL